MPAPRIPRRQSAFSLIELLIVVAIIAALVGVAAPFFQDNLSEAQRTKAGQDLEVLKKAIAQYDARESNPLVGTDLSPLLGRYMQELSKDPWGNAYLFDGAAGVLASYGADALPEGAGGDADVVVFTRPELMLRRAQYVGPWGRADGSGLMTGEKIANKFVVTMTKPFQLTAPGGEAEIELLTSAEEITPTALTFAQNWDGVAGQDWELGDGSATGVVSDPLHRPELGSLVLRPITNMRTNSSAQAITPTMALDFHVSVGNFFLESHYTGASPASPLDPTVYGSATTVYQRRPAQVPRAKGLRTGVRIERY